MNVDLPNWTPFDPRSGASGAEDRDGPDGLGYAHYGPGPGELCAVAISPGLGRSEWVARAVVALARHSRGVDAPRALLIDLSLEVPILAGSEGQEGLSDAFRFGSSLSRVVHEDGEGVHRVGPGSPVADPRDVLADPGWEVIRERLAADRRGAFAAIPLDLAGAMAFVRGADSAILMCTRDEFEEGALRSARSWIAIIGPPDRLTATGAPPAPEAGEGSVGEDPAPEVSGPGFPEPEESLSRPAAAPEPDQEVVRAVSELGRLDPEPAPEADPEDLRPDVPEPEDEPTITPARVAGRQRAESPPRARTASPEQRNSTLWFVGALLLVAAVVLLLALLGLIDLPGLSSGSAAANLPEVPQTP